VSWALIADPECTLCDPCGPSAERPSLSLLRLASDVENPTIPMAPAHDEELFKTELARQYVTDLSICPRFTVFHGSGPFSSGFLGKCSIGSLSIDIL